MIREIVRCGIREGGGEPGATKSLPCQYLRISWSVYDDGTERMVEGPE